MFQSNLIECSGVSLISISCLIDNTYFVDHLYYLVYLIITAVFLTFSKKENLKRDKTSNYRQNVDYGIIYGLITIPTLLSTQTKLASGDQPTSTAMYENIMNITSLTMPLLISVYCLWLWSSKIKTFLGSLVLVVFLYNQPTSVVMVFLYTFCVALYTGCTIFIIPRILPGSFSFGELSAIIQGVGLVLMDFGFKLMFRYQYPRTFLRSVNEQVLALQTIFVSWLLIVIVLSPVFYCMVYHETVPSDKYIFSVCFYIGAALNLLVIFLPLWYYMLAVNPVVWLLNIIMKEEHIYLIGYWMLLVAISIYVIIQYHGNITGLAVPKTIVRKFFHFIAILVYLPVINNQLFISLISGIVIILMLIVELIRIFRIAPFGNSINDIFQPLLDDNDNGKIITTHIYLILGMTIPLWLYTDNRSTSLTSKTYSLSLFSGIVSIGIGDSCASIFGKLYGVVKLPGSKKTWFGCFCCAAFQFAFILILMKSVSVDYSLTTLQHVVLACCFTAFLEGVSEQIDNIILPLYMYILLR